MAKHFIPLAMALAVALSACAPALRVAGEAIEDAPGAEERAYKLASYPRPFADSLPAVVPEDRHAEPMGLTDVAWSLPDYTIVADLEGGFLLGAGCRINGPKTFRWREARPYAARVDYMSVFFGAMQGMGYSVVGDPSDLFLKPEDLDPLVYRVGALITDVELELCLQAHWWKGEYTGRARGSAFMRVDWQVYSERDEKRVFRITTEGRAALSEPTDNGIGELLLGSFREAARELGETEGFLRTVSLERGTREAALPVAAASQRSRWAPMALPNRKLFDEPFVDHSQELLQAAVSIPVGGGHGSGFFVTEDGYLLTNQHVVGNARKVRVRLHDGLELEGEVLRRDRKRDVALVKVPVSRAKVLPIRHRPLAVGEGVYAIGSPLDLDLSGTVSRGVVSAHRVGPQSDLPTIQADVDIHGGNSGGPLVDAFGNVVGITVIVLTDSEKKFSTGINFFIPIRSALKHLGIELPPEPTS